MRLLLLACLSSSLVWSAVTPAVRNVVVDRFRPAPYEQQKIEGILGERLRVNEQGRLLHVDEKALMEGFTNRPGKHPWIGEHVGKFLHAGVNTYRYTHNEELKALLDRMAKTLIASQLPDGYLGTYADSERWTSWDVWVHKYNLIGLLSYYDLTGDESALTACRKMGDLLATTFGPGKRDIVASSTHVGMAAMSILEPMVDLYRYTGDKKYLQFAEYLVRAYEQPNGPKIVSSLFSTNSVYKTANAKAYEMLSNLVGLVALHRLTGEPKYLRAVELAWLDIANHRLYITGTVSSHEHFTDDNVLPGEASSDVGEGCATVTWLQLNWHLLRLTGDIRYADQLERTIYNQLLGAQDAGNGNICYFTPLNGRKNATPGVNCCVSSEPRGISMIPQIAWGVRDYNPVVELYTPGEVTLPVRTDLVVKLKEQTDFPQTGAVTLTVSPAKQASFYLQLRVPRWATHYVASIGKKKWEGKPGEYLYVDREWKPGDQVQIDMGIHTSLLDGGKSYPGYVAVQRGPQILALDSYANPGVPFLQRAALANPGALQLKDAAGELPGTWVGKQAYSTAGLIAAPSGDKLEKKEQPLLLVPFADAKNYRVWLIRPDKLSLAPVAATAFAKQTSSGRQPVDGSICDERTDTYLTARKDKAGQSWYALEMTQPASIGRVVYRVGQTGEKGGWFNGEPRVEIKRSATSDWEAVEATESKNGDVVEWTLKAPVETYGLRVIGTPENEYVSCAELEGYTR